MRRLRILRKATLKPPAKAASCDVSRSGEEKTRAVKVDVRTIVPSLVAFMCTTVCNAATDEHRVSAWYPIKVHMSTEVGVVESTFLAESEDTATDIFSKIGVHLTWRTGHKNKGPSTAAECPGHPSACDISVEIVAHAPATASRGALAMAKPYADSGVRISVFFDRVAPLRQRHHASPATVLGYVLAHEIAHVLQGVARHSERGIMLARWTENEFAQMGIGALTFDPEDVELIRRRFDVVLAENDHDDRLPAARSF